jgi:hypothetical protein
MRLWSLDASLLDAKGLVACWREALLAQAVLWGQTEGYLHHPQLDRFREGTDGKSAIATFLWDLYAESITRGYSFSPTKINLPRTEIKIPVTSIRVLAIEAQVGASRSESLPAAAEAGCVVPRGSRGYLPVGSTKRVSIYAALTLTALCFMLRAKEIITCCSHQAFRLPFTKLTWGVLYGTSGRISRSMRVIISGTGTFE